MGRPPKNRDLIRQLAPTHTVNEIVERSGYSMRGVRYALRAMGLRAKPGYPSHNRSQEWLRLYVDERLSARQIAKRYGVTPGHVLGVLHYHRVLRPSPGKDIERDVLEWVVGRYPSAMKQKGDRPFDLLIAGERIDVKSAKESMVGGKYPRFVFAIHHKLSGRTTSEADWYWFVLKDRPGRPIYRCLTTDIICKLNVGISFETFHADPRFSFVGFLGERKGGDE